jgi:biofilm PGA synthesis protein PgaA
VKLARITSIFIVTYALASGDARGTAAAAVAAHPWSGEQSDAVLLARHGDTESALAILARLARAHPEDSGVARDLVVVTAWAGHDDQAIRLYDALPEAAQPDYVLAAVALAYRHTGRPAESLALYRQGLRHTPRNPEFTAGEIRSLSDLHQAAPALAAADADLLVHGERLDVLLAAGYAASAEKKPVEALRYIDRAVTLDPAAREPRHDRILAIGEMGAPQIARRLADDNPGLLTQAELRRLDGDAAAALVRWGVFEPPSEARRFDASDRAIAALDALLAQWSQAGDGALSDKLRARFDRMVALRDRVRMSDVLAEYEELKGQGVAIPGYALVAAADAYLYLRQPEIARDLYLRGLAVDPLNPETRLALFYAYIDLEDFAAAYQQVDRAAADQPIWLYLKGLKEPIENPEHATADLAAADARLYADELAEANRRIAAIEEAAPNNSRARTALANIYSARGWPRYAAEEYEISRALKPLDVTTEIGQARNNLDLHAYADVEAQLAQVKARFPENREVQRLDRLWAVHNMAEISIIVAPRLGSSSTVQGDSGFAIDTEIHSAPIDYRWRIFGSEYVAREKLTAGEGALSLRRSGIGAEYRGGTLLASLETTISAFGPRFGTTLTSGIDHGRAGARALATWSANDYWQFGGSAEIFARDTPMRALSHGITANAGAANMAYRVSESRAFLLSGEVMSFSDGNQRIALAAKLSQRLVTLPRFSIDGILELAPSHNSADGNRPYYNPRHDVLAAFGVSINQVIYRRYEFSYDHHLVVSPGIYWERGFGTAGVASVLYEHRIRSNDVLEAGLGVTLGRQSYDAEYQNSVAVLFNLRARF